MYKLLFILLFISNLYSKTDNATQNPVVYAVLGDTIYNNVKKIESLKKLQEFQVYLDEILPYVKEVKATKAMGYKIEEGDTNISKSKYLTKLRKLSKINDFFVQNIRNNFKYSLKHKDNQLFVHSVDSGLLDIKRYQRDIKKYYYAHEDEIEEYGDILSMIVNGYKSKFKKKKKKVYHSLSKKEIQDAKMKRIRKKDKAKQEALNKALEAELINKKVNIRKVQKKELESTSN